MTAAALVKVDEVDADGGGDDATKGRKVVKDVGGIYPRSKAGDECGGDVGGICGGDVFREGEWGIVGFEEVEMERELRFVAEVDWWGF